MDLRIMLIQLLKYFINSLIMVSLGIILINIKLDWKKVLGTAVFISCTSLYVDSLPLVFGLGLLITILVAASVVMVYWFLNFYQALLAVLLGLTSSYLIHGALVPVIVYVFNINPTVPASLLQMLLLIIPQGIAALLTAYILLHYHLFLLDFQETRLIEHPLSGKRDRLMFALYAFLLIFIIFEMIYNLNDFGYELQESIKSANLLTLNWISNITIILTIIIVSVLLKNLLELSEKEHNYIVQKSYSETLEEVYTVVRAEQHDLINHFQTLYGFLELKYNEEALHYLESLIGSTPVLKSISDTGSVPLSALLYIKSGLAKERNIRFAIEIKSALTDIAIPSYEINRIIGNLINNSFEAVADEKEENRWASLVIDQDDHFCIFKVSNFGFLSQDMLEKMLARGFSTKNQNGLGLFVVKSLVKKYNGTLKIDSHDNQVIINLRLPKQPLPDTLN